MRACATLAFDASLALSCETYSTTIHIKSNPTTSEPLPLPAVQLQCPHTAPVHSVSVCFPAEVLIPLRHARSQRSCFILLALVVHVFAQHPTEMHAACNQLDWLPGGRIPRTASAALPLHVSVTRLITNKAQLEGGTLTQMA